MSVFTCTLPKPPSVNQCYANNKGSGRGRVRTKRYREWAQAAGYDVLHALRANQAKIGGGFHLVLTFDEKQRRTNQDLDNLIKPVLDLLQEHGVITNDKHCNSINASWGVVSDGGCCVSVWSENNEEAA